jgi:mono/diheme cytochrome c family protein
MKSAIFKTSLLTTALLLSSGVVFAQQKSIDFGKMEFDANCAVCHGEDAKGNGSLRELLRASPPDLTLLAKNNKGIFPMGRMYEVIDGAGVPSHGSREMPIWGKTYRIRGCTEPAGGTRSL